MFDQVEIDVTPLSIGIEWPKGVYTSVIFKGTPIPVQRSHLFVIESGEEKLELEFDLLWGEFPRVEGNNRRICTVQVSGFTFSSRQQAVDVFFDIDVNGLIVLSAKSHKGKELQVKMTQVSKGLSIKEMVEMRREENRR